MIFPFRPASLIPHIYVTFVILEWLMFYNDRICDNKIKTFFNLAVLKFISICSPYVIQLLIIRNDTKGWSSDIASRYILEAEEYLNEAFTFTPVFALLFFMVELPFFTLIVKVNNNKKRYIKKFVLLNIILIVLLYLIDFVLCRHAETP